jgi:Calcineurin-like phosphoesterase
VTSRPRRWPVALAALVVIGALAATLAFVLVGRRDAQPDTAVGSPPSIRVPTTGRTVVWAVGDGPDDGPAAKRVAGLIAASHPDLVLYLGDVYTADYHAFPAAFDGLADRVAPTPGNHDWPQNAREGYLRYWKQVQGSPLAGYYSLRAGGWQLLSLNSEAAHDAGSAQVAWLRGQVRGPGTCRIGFWHRPRYSAGKHGDQPDVAPLWDTLSGHAALVLAGHDHDMQRLRPVDGITELVSGAGGHSHYAVDRGDRRTAFADDTKDGALRLTLSPGRAELAFVAVDGRTLDTSTVSCTKP